MKPPALFRPRLTPNLNAPGRSRSFTRARRATSLGGLICCKPSTHAWAYSTAETLPMLRFSCLLAVIVLTSGSVEAQTKKGAKSADSYRRAECDRELGYTRAQARSQPRPPLKRSISALREGERILQRPPRSN